MAWGKKLLLVWRLSFIFAALALAQPALADFYPRGNGAGNSGVDQLIAGSGIAISPGGGTGTVTISALSSGGSVTSVGASSTFPGLNVSVTNPTTTPMISMASFTGLTSHQVIGTFAGSTVTLSSLTAGDLPGAANPLSQFNSNGILVQTALNIFVARNIVSTSGTTMITNGSGGGGNISVDLPSSGVTAGSYTATNLTVNAQGIITAASNGSGAGTVSSVTAADSTLTITPTTGAVTAKIATSAPLAGSPTTTTQAASDNSTKIATTAYADALAAGNVKVGNVSNIGVAVSLSGDVSTTSNAGVIALAQPLHAIVGYNTNGYFVQTAANTFAGRTFTSTGGTLTVTNASGVSGNTNYDLPSSGVSGGSYTNANITVNAQGIVTAASNGSGGGGGVSSVSNSDGSILSTPTTGAVVISVATNGVTNAKFRQSAGISVVGNSTSSTANVSDITATSNNQVLASNSGGTALAFRSLTAADEPATTVNSTGNLTPLFTSSISGQALSFTISTIAGHTFIGNNSGSTASIGAVSITNGDLPTSGVSPGSYTNSSITVNAQGIVTSASSGAASSGIVNSGTTGQMTYYAGNGTTVSGNANATISGGALTLGQSATAGSLILNGSSSGTCTLNTAAAAGSITLTLPASIPTVPTGTGVTGGAQVQSSTSGALSVSNTPLRFKSTAQVLTTADSVTIAHSLGAAPTKCWMVCQNTTADAGYSIGDQIVIYPGFGSLVSGTGYSPLSIQTDATNVYIYTGNIAPIIQQKGGGGVATFTYADWEEFIYAEP